MLRKLLILLFLLSGFCAAGTAEEPVLPDLSDFPLADRLIIVSADSPRDGTLAYYQKNPDGTWQEVFSAPCYTGRKGLDKTAEGDGRTPSGTFPMGIAFGNEPDPGAAVPYLQVDGSYYWVDDVNSQHYNRLVTTQDVKKDWRLEQEIK